MSDEKTENLAFQKSASWTLLDSLGCFAISDQILPTLANSLRE
jgi:hypothetical protein